jgi:GTP1/Obg family GTP-binding protein
MIKRSGRSTFQLCKITYETSYSPFGEAIASFRNILTSFQFDRIEEVYNYLVSTYLQAKNYKAALASLDKIQNKGSRMEEAYQRVLFSEVWNYLKIWSSMML